MNQSDLHSLYSELCKFSYARTTERLAHPFTSFCKFVDSSKTFKFLNSACTQKNEKVFFFGGINKNFFHSNIFQEFDLTEKDAKDIGTKFSKIVTQISPKPREGHSMVNFNYWLLVFGGKKVRKMCRSTWKYDIVSNYWEKLQINGQCPKSRCYHIGQVIENLMIIHAGRSESKLHSCTWALDLRCFTWKKLKKSDIGLRPREQMCSVVMDNKIFVFGGRSNTDFSDDFFKIWEKNGKAFASNIYDCGQKPLPRAFCSVSAFKESHLVVVGGEASCTILNDIWIYDYIYNKWEEVLPMNQILPIMGHLSCIYADKLILFGGISDNHKLTKNLIVLGQFEDSLHTNFGINFNKIGTSKLEENKSKGKILKQFRNSCNSRTSHYEFVNLFRVIPHLNETCIRILNAYKLGYQQNDLFSALVKISNFFQDKCIHYDLIAENFEVMSKRPIKLNPPCIPLNSNHFSPKKNNDKEFFMRKQLLSNWKSGSSSKLSTLNVHLDVNFTPDEHYMILSNFKSNGIVYALLNISKRVLILSKSERFSSIGLLKLKGHNTYLAFIVFDIYGNIVYPCEDLIQPNIKYILSNSHFNRIDLSVFNRNFEIFLYSKDLLRNKNDITYKGKSFSSLAAFLNNNEVWVNQKMIVKRKFKILNESNEDIKIFKINSENFSILIYFKEKLVYWQYQQANQSSSFLILVSDSNLISATTGLIDNKENLEKIKSFLIGKF